MKNLDEYNYPPGFDVQQEFLESTDDDANSRLTDVLCFGPSLAETDADSNIGDQGHHHQLLFPSKLAVLEDHCLPERFLVQINVVPQHTPQLLELTDDDLDAVLESIDLCRATLHGLYLRAAMFLDPRGLAGTMVIMACQEQRNHLTELQLDHLALQVTDIVSLFQSPHCVIQNLALKEIVWHQRRRDDDPYPFTSLWKDYGRLQELVVTTLDSPNTSSITEAFLQALQNTPSRLKFLKLTPILKSGFETLMETLQCQPSLTSLHFTIGRPRNLIQAFNETNVIGLLQRILSLQRPALQDLDVWIERGSVHVLSLNQYLSEKGFRNFTSTILQPNATLVSFPCAEEEGHDLSMVKDILERNRIVTRLQKQATKKGEQHHQRNKTTTQAPQEKADDDANQPPQPHTLAATISKLASTSVKATALHYYLVLNVDRIQKLSQVQDNRTKKRPTIP